MVEKLVLDLLSDALEVSCYMEVPERRPERFVVIDKTGSRTEEHLFTSMVAVQSYGPSKLAAAQLSSKVVSAMKDLALLDEVCRCDLNSEYPFPDIGAKEYRYQAVFNIVHY